VMAELGVAYGVTFGVMAVSSLFSVGALGRMMYMDLGMVNVVSVGVVMVIFLIFYGLSVKAFGRNAGVW
jgi:putative ABC transport system permease protein